MTRILFQSSCFSLMCSGLCQLGVCTCNECRVTFKHTSHSMAEHNSRLVRQTGYAALTSLMHARDTLSTHREVGADADHELLGVSVVHPGLGELAAHVQQCLGEQVRLCVEYDDAAVAECC